MDFDHDFLIDEHEESKIDEAYEVAYDNARDLGKSHEEAHTHALWFCSHVC